ncbi:MAG: ribosomal protein S18-alanine N-acetyltransferase [Bacillota bacterium]|nr:ribosomal protein S18-alanine N-acetyltransferase [Bacillota bacterium]
MKPIIRFMSIDDIPKIVAEDRRILGQTLGEKTLRTELADNPFTEYYVLEDKVTKAFYGHVSVWIDTPLAQIINIYIVPEQQRAGLGTFLIEFVLTLLKSRGCNTLTLEVRPTNAAAIAFYQKFGFTKMTVRKQYYEDGEDADLMLLNF